MPNSDFSKPNMNEEEDRKEVGKQQERVVADVDLNKDALKKRQITYRTTNVGNWNEELLKSVKSKSNGSKILIKGVEGTVKATTAERIAREFNKKLSKVDLSKGPPYIGETEKDLVKLFYKAEKEDWILFFDEADELFDKRTNVKDSHDRYANREMNYLLQRIEDFKGVVIIATSKPNEAVHYSDIGIHLDLVLTDGHEH